jgi:hypothetical protein
MPRGGVFDRTIEGGTVARASAFESDMHMADAVANVRGTADEARRK